MALVTCTGPQQQGKGSFLLRSAKWEGLCIMNLFSFLCTGFPAGGYSVTSLIAAILSIPMGFIVSEKPCNSYLEV